MPSTPTHTGSAEPKEPKIEVFHLVPLPPPHLLLALPSLLIHPPTHKYHLQSLLLSQRALRRCLALPESELDRDIECRAWTALAEIGIGCLALGTGQESIQGEIEAEVEKALTKAVSASPFSCHCA
jgi:hypothetical protein